MKRLLITGGKGQLATAFKSNFKSDFDLLSLDSNELDITDKLEVESILVKFKPDIVLNCAAYTNVDGAENDFKKANEVNSVAVRNILSKFDGLFVQISTDYIFDGKNGPYSEFASSNPINKYGLSKLNGEEIALKMSNHLILIRANVIFDLNSKSSFLDWVIRSLKNKKEISVVNDQYGNPIWSVDLAKIIFQLIKNDEKGIFNVGTDKIISRYEFAKLIANEWSLDVNLIKPISTKSLKERNKNYIAPRPLKSGLLIRDKFPKISLRDSLIALKKK